MREFRPIGALRLRATAAAVAALALGATLAAPARAETTRVSYLAGASVYVDAGRAEGIAEGDTLDVMRGGQRVARLRAVYLSMHRASCDTLAVLSPLAVGDAVSFTAHAAPAPVAADTVAPAPVKRRSTAVLHGRVGLRYLFVDQPGISRYSQPGFDLRLDGANLGEQPIDLAVDVRTRRATRVLADQSTTVENESRVYRLALSMRDRSGAFRVTVGRQSPPLLTSVSLFDGALAYQQGRRWSLGAFAGLEPDPESFGVSGDVLQHGLFIERHQAPMAAQRWSLALGGAMSSVRGELNRNFAFVQGFFRNSRLSGSVTQEVDFNSGWKTAMGEPRIAPSNTFAIARADVTPSLAVNTGYDNRRSVRLWRDRTTPEDQFDDHFRQGAWLGASYDIARALRLSGDARASATSIPDGAWAWTASSELRRVLPVHGTVRGRWSLFDSQDVRNTLVSLSVGFDPFEAAHLEFSGGQRGTDDLQVGTSSVARWQSVDFDMALRNRLQLTASMERTRGDFDNLLQEDVALRWRF